jgi:hypothetical protein
MWTKYEYLCTTCDALIEVTANVPQALDPDCICGQGNVIRINKYPVTDITSNHLDSLNPIAYN